MITLHDALKIAESVVVDGTPYETVQNAIDACAISTLDMFSESTGDISVITSEVGLQLKIHFNHGLRIDILTCKITTTDIRPAPQE